MSGKIKASDVKYYHVSYKPVPRCMGRFLPNMAVPDEVCNWDWVPTLSSLTSEAKKQARKHAMENPGHQVEVVQRNVSYYSVDPPEPADD